MYVVRVEEDNIDVGGGCRASSAIVIIREGVDTSLGVRTSFRRE